MIDLSELMRDGVVVVDPSGEVRYANAAATTIAAPKRRSDLADLSALPAGLVELRPAKWVELRHAPIDWEGVGCRVAIITDVTAQIALKESHRRLREIGLIDPLTGLATEPVLRDHLERSLALAERDHRWVGVIWLALNRTIRQGVEGQRVADEVLRQCAVRVLPAIRESDLAAVFDENTIVIALTAMRRPVDAQIVAVRLLLSLAPPVLVEGGERSVGVASGAVTASDRSVPVDELLARARAAVESDDPVGITHVP
jgi:GGDEF domain-containing protein